MLLTSLFYIFVVLELDYPLMVRSAISIAAAYFGMHSPNLFLKKRFSAGRLSIKRAFPDALDLLLICVESGMSIEAAFRKVSEEIGFAVDRAGRGADPHSPPNCPTCPIAAWPMRISASGPTSGHKAVCLALQQAERYGTPLGTDAAGDGQENRDMRLSEARRRPPACRRS